MCSALVGGQYIEPAVHAAKLHFLDVNATSLNESLTLMQPYIINARPNLVG